jgi:hypothetical protein
MFTPTDLVRSSAWDRLLFTTYALSLSFFEAVILDQILRSQSGEALVLADVDGVRAALSEYGARVVGREYQLEPIRVNTGYFHPKLMTLLGKNDAHLVIGSGNLTFGGWGLNLECAEHLHYSFAADAFSDTAGFLAALCSSEYLVGGLTHQTRQECEDVSEQLRSFAKSGRQVGRVHVLHNLSESLASQITRFAEELGGATALTAISPFHDGFGLDLLCRSLGLDRARVYVYPGGFLKGVKAENWPSNARIDVLPVTGITLDGGFNDEEPRPLHGKALEIVCRRGRLVISGSANATSAALDAARNIELVVVRVQTGTSSGWRLSPCAPPVQVSTNNEDPTDDLTEGILRASLEGDFIEGTVLTPFPPGEASAELETGSLPLPLGVTKLDSQRTFKLHAAGLEKHLWSGMGCVLRLAHDTAIVRGFIALPGFASVIRHGIKISRHIASVLSGTETPADVAAMMTWFYENPDFLSHTPPAGNFSQDTRDGDELAEIPVAELVPSIDRHNLLPTNGTDAEAGWKRFMQGLFAAFRKPRGPLFSDVRPDIEPDGDDAEESSSKDESEHQEQIQKALVSFDRLLWLMLDSPRGKADPSMVYQLTEYVCDRLEPDNQIASEYLNRLIAFFLQSDLNSASRQHAVEAILVWAAQLAAPPSDLLYAAKYARRRLLAIEARTSGTEPAIDPLGGFARILAPGFDFGKLWSDISSVTTIQEEIRKYEHTPAAERNRSSFSYLSQYSELFEPQPNGRSHYRILVQYSDVCPVCSLSLPTADAMKLREYGIVRHSSHLLLCEEY